VRLLPRRAASDPSADSAVATTEDVRTESKGRPTPKRRDSGPRRGPVSPAPKTRREAMQRQREQAKLAKSSPRRGVAPPLSAADRRARQMAGDPAYLQRRDQGELRAFARDYVDSRRMVANYLLVLFPVALLSQFVHFLITVEVTLVLLVLLEGVFTGRRIIAMARQRDIDLGRETGSKIALYAIMRAYFPRRWRMPRPRVAMGETI
jgi:hypothetical protein